MYNTHLNSNGPSRRALLLPHDTNQKGMPHLYFSWLEIPQTLQGITTYDYVIAVRTQSEPPVNEQHSLQSSPFSSAPTAISDALGLQYKGAWRTPPQITENNLLSLGLRLAQLQARSLTFTTQTDLPWLPSDSTSGDLQPVALLPRSEHPSSLRLCRSRTAGGGNPLAWPTDPLPWLLIDLLHNSRLGFLLYRFEFYTRVIRESSYKLRQSRRANNQVNVQTKEKVLLGRQKQGATGALDEGAWTVGSEHQSPPFILVGVLRAIPPVVKVFKGMAFRMLGTQREKERPSLGEFLSHLGTLPENDLKEDDLKKDGPLEDEDLKTKCLFLLTTLVPPDADCDSDPNQTRDPNPDPLKKFSRNQTRDPDPLKYDSAPTPTPTPLPCPFPLLSRDPFSIFPACRHSPFTLSRLYTSDVLAVIPAFLTNGMLVEWNPSTEPYFAKCFDCSIQ
ncbi:hypothetical protein IEQ34_008227 [Dendrobium chrysotoxum]|uniref:Uncharacterized protein n=1 Tax=Dendrobium chrysotoxum TaxID=161865 RepID=A0AAV7H6I6_DENCH|nr:hypothetical protein IEQ34_008227 [Dendrobium chrysotoxum]